MMNKGTLLVFIDLTFLFQFIQDVQWKYFQEKRESIDSRVLFKQSCFHNSLSPENSSLITNLAHV